MTKDEFKEVSAKTFNVYFRNIRRFLRDGSMKSTGPVSYPTGIRLAESPLHFVLELYGAQPTFERLLCADNYFEQIPDASTYFVAGPRPSRVGTSSMFVIKDTSDNGIFGCALTSKYDQLEFERKINYRLCETKLVMPDMGAPVFLGEEANYFCVSDCDIVRSDGIRVWFRTVAFAYVVRKDDLAVTFGQHLERLLTSSFSDPVPSKTGPAARALFGLGGDSDNRFGRELISLADSPVDERMLDEFIQKHAKAFAAALGHRRAISQPRLDFRDSEPGAGEFLRPDYLLEREDGLFDILDLKKALLPAKSVTIGKRPRIRFISYVQEMIAQLSGYARYFKSPMNSAFALEKYGVRVARPKLYGLVGNYDNAKPKDVSLAAESCRDDLVVMSYWDLDNLHRRRLKS